MWRSIVFLVVVVASLNACAFGTREVKLSYPPQAPKDAGIANTSEPIEKGNGQTILLLTVKNQRKPVDSDVVDDEGKEIVGHVRNTYGMQTANIVTTDNMEEWVENAIAYELKQHNYNVIREVSQLEEPEEHLILQGSTFFIYIDNYFNYDGQVKLHIVLKKGGTDEILIDKVYEGQAKEACLAATEEGYKNALEVALSKAIKQMLSDISRL
jgi:hypothetical protein